MYKPQIFAILEAVKKPIRKSAAENKIIFPGGRFFKIIPEKIEPRQNIVMLIEKVIDVWLLDQLKASSKGAANNDQA